MILPPPWPQVLDFFGTPLVIEPLPSQFSSEAGLLPIRQFDQCIGLTWAFADALDDPRDLAALLELAQWCQFRMPQHRG